MRFERMTFQLSAMRSHHRTPHSVFSMSSFHILCTSTSAWRVSERAAVSREVDRMKRVTDHPDNQTNNSAS